MTEKEQSTSSNQVIHQHGRLGPNLLTDHSTEHHHHSRLLYFLTDPSSILSLSRLSPFSQQPPFLFPSLLTPPKSTTTTTTLAPLLPSQPIAVAAVDDCCNKCCPQITTKPPPTTPTPAAAAPTSVVPSEEETRCKWSSCVATFNTMEDLTPHLVVGRRYVAARATEPFDECALEASAAACVQVGELHRAV
ncbi:hypothetical protein HPULCUR_009082 [Helicostylum pulchrum]|uniref:Uncharacterized protein n=1 Tax=Helicostylum pulchrum TaxID=562976 RepID=A0ABP9Y9F8_9FUNG